MSLSGKRNKSAELSAETNGITDPDTETFYIIGMHDNGMDEVGTADSLREAVRLAERRILLRGFAPFYAFAIQSPFGDWVRTLEPSPPPEPKS